MAPNFNIFPLVESLFQPGEIYWKFFSFNNKIYWKFFSFQLQIWS